MLVITPIRSHLNICGEKGITLRPSQLQKKSVVNKKPFLLWRECGISIAQVFPQEVHIHQEKLFKRVQKYLDLFVQFLVLVTKLFDLVNGMKNGCVMLIPELATNLR